CCLALACITDLTHAFLPPLFFLLTPRPPRSTLFPYTTLFRSQGDRQRFVALHQEMQTGEKEGCQRLNAVGRHRTFSGRHAQSDGHVAGHRLHQVAVLGHVLPEQTTFDVEQRGQTCAPSDEEQRPYADFDPPLELE